MSSYRNTDAHLRVIMRQPDNLAKLLILYNANNTVRIRRDALFAANPGLASRWYFKFLQKFNTGCVDGNSFEHLRMHLTHVDDRLRLPHPEAATDAYFGSTYIDNVGSLIFDHEEAAHFKHAIDHLIANREDLAALGRRSPIVLEK